MSLQSLTDSQWDQCSALLAHLRPLSGEERAAALQALGAQDQVDPRVLSLVAGRLRRPPAPDRCRTGERIGNFTLGEEIGAGGMGVVYRARQTTLERDVALKLIHPRFVLTGRPEAVKRFQGEIRTLVEFTHEGIAQIHEGGIHTDPTTGEQIPFFAMQLIQDGVPITVYAQEHDLSIEARLRLFVRVCAALAPVHHRRVVHRDLKPTNILVDWQGNPFVIDFGLAHVWEPARWPRGEERFAGTLPYMSPEQVAAEDSPVSQRSDVYTLGVILYELLTGQPPYALSPHVSWDTLRQAILTEVPAPLSQYNAACQGALDTIVAKMLAKDPAARYASAADCQLALEAYLTESMIEQVVGRVIQAHAPRPPGAGMAEDAHQQMAAMEYQGHLPLPLAQLYSRAYNAKYPRSRHDNTFYLFEALIKLTAAPLIATYVHEVRRGAQRVSSLDSQLERVALPSLGHWMGIVRELAQYFGTRADAAHHPLGHLWEQLNHQHYDKPGLLRLYQCIENRPQGALADVRSCSILAVLDKLPQYRNAVLGLEADRHEAFYEHDLGPLLLPAVNEVLASDIFSPLGPKGTRLVYLDDLRVMSETIFEVNLEDLVGYHGERAAPMRVSREDAQELVPRCVAVLWPGWPLPLRLDPLLVYRQTKPLPEVLFLNGDCNHRRVEYLSYTTGQIEHDETMTGAMVKFLSLVTGRTVTKEGLEALQQQSIDALPAAEVAQQLPPVRLYQMGDYEILAEIGRGGMGVVYLARQLSLGRIVALKMLPDDLARDAVALARFRREIHALARCDHPNIIKVLTSGTLPDGRLYYAMEYVPGADLEQVWHVLASQTGQASASGLSNSTFMRAVLSASGKRRQETEARRTPGADAGADRSATPAVRSLPAGETVVAAAAVPHLPLPPLPALPSVEDNPGGYVRRVVMLIRDAALALQAVHDEQIIHRDVKPANLMLTPDGTRVVLMDFGLAKGQETTLAASRQGGLLGTMRYAAPEQLAAANLSVGPAADVRGLGVTMWELLTRRRLFAEAQDEKQLAMMIHELDVPRLRTIDASFNRDLEAIVARATERRIKDRIATAGELAAYLQLYLDDQPLPIRPPSKVELGRRWVRRHTGRVAAGCAAAILLILCFTYREYATEAVAWIGQASRVAWSPGHALPLHTSDQQKVTRVLDRLASDLSARLEGGESDRINAWTTAQMAVAVSGLKQFDAASVVAYLDRQMGPGCPCWREFPNARYTPHIGATAWVLIALAKLNRQATPDQLEYLLRARSGDEPWWPISQGVDEASTYATSLAVLALHQQLRLAAPLGVERSTIETAIKRGATWLYERRGKDKARWKDYPSPRRDARRVVESVGLSGQVLHVLHLTYGSGLLDIERLWLQSLPSVAEIAQADTVEQSNRDLYKDGKAFQKEATKYYPLQWTIVGTVDTSGHGSIVERTRALRLVEHALGSLDAQAQVALNAGNWVAAELLIALRHLAGESALGRGWHTEEEMRKRGANLH